MSQPIVSFTQRSIQVHGYPDSNAVWPVEYPIDELRVIGVVIVVLYEYTSGSQDVRFRNLEAFDLSGRHLWLAELPGTSDSCDSYTGILSEHPLTAYSWSGCRCEIDLATGEILRADVVK